MPDATKSGPQAQGTQLERGERTARDRRLDLTDRVAARFITLGGAAIVLSVIAIVIFVGAGALPLLKGARTEQKPIASAAARPKALLLTADEYQQKALILDAEGVIHIVALSDSDGAQTERLTLCPEVSGPLTAALDFGANLIAIGDGTGTLHLYDFDWKVSYTDSGRRIRAAVTDLRQVPLLDSGMSFRRLVAARNSEGAVRVVAEDNRGELSAYSYDPAWDEEEIAPVERLAGSGRPDWSRSMTLTPDGHTLAVGAQDGRVALYDLEDPNQPSLDQAFPASDVAVSAVGFLIGGTSLITGDAAGTVKQWLPVRGTSGGSPRYTAVREFKAHPQPVIAVAPSPRNKGFITLDEAGGWHLNYATANRTYLEMPAKNGALSLFAYTPKANGLVALTKKGQLLHWSLDAPHLEATLKTLFGKVWYEGYQKPEYVWQSTGGSDAFEPKLSLIPLIFGTLKGTFYAMLFSVPIAIMAALYISQLARPGLRTTVKPAIEVMAAIPSVVVGFLAALWLAPLVEKHLIGTVMLLLFVPLFAVGAAFMMLLVPGRLRQRLPEGSELFVALPFALLGAWLALQLGPLIERAFFGGDVTQWLFSARGISYDQRNNIVVGIAMGFAVIPIIFTVAEDALSNVPQSLVSGALALGASRWQATWRIVLRAASPGIFAAVMLGLGRAVGETMIVLMATGNTPLMDWSIFNGMRTMSAAIAVEIPEAPQGGTLYRVLFLVAFLLFCFTLLLNTAANLVSTRLRRRYGRF